jgi:peptide/nickel transport system ATP-binding protein
MTAYATSPEGDKAGCPPPPLLSVSGLRIEISGGAPIVDEVGFTLAPGRALGVVGESGSGKTTVALGLLGYARHGTRIVAGSVRLGDFDLLALDPDRRRQLRGAAIAYVPQSPARSLNPSMRVGRQLAEVMDVHRPGTASDAAIERLLERVGLPVDRPFRRRLPHQLSGGQQQRLALATALSCDARVLVLDEPTTGLDVVTKRRVLAEIGRLRGETGTGVVLVSHDLSTVAGVVDDIAVMYGGYVVESGPVTDVLAWPVHPYTAGLVASVPDISQRRALRGIPGTAVGVLARGPGCPFAPRCELRTSRCDLAMPPPAQFSPGREVRCHHSGALRPSVRPPAVLVAPPHASPPLLEVREPRVLHRGAGRLLGARR